MTIKWKEKFRRRSQFKRNLSQTDDVDSRFNAFYQDYDGYGGKVITLLRGGNSSTDSSDSNQRSMICVNQEDRSGNQEGFTLVVEPYSLEHIGELSCHWEKKTSKLSQIRHHADKQSFQFNRTMAILEASIHERRKYRVDRLDADYGHFKMFRFFNLKREVYLSVWSTGRIGVVRKANRFNLFYDIPDSTGYTKTMTRIV